MEISTVKVGKIPIVKIEKKVLNQEKFLFSFRKVLKFVIKFANSYTLHGDMVNVKTIKN